MNGSELRAVRERNKLSRADMAKILGVSEKYVAKLETERKDKPLSEQVDARLSEFVDFPEEEPPPDELPSGGYTDASEDSTPSGKLGGTKVVGGWQAEATTMLAVLIRGQVLQVAGTDGTVPIVIPGLAHGVQALWCPICAGILARAADPFAAAFVKAYPSLARKLLAPGPQAELILVLATQILVPCLMHHLHLGHSQNDNGDRPEGEDGQGDAAA